MLLLTIPFKFSHPMTNPSLVDGIIGEPIDDIRNIRIYADRAQRRPGIFLSGIRATQEHAETYRADLRDANIAPFSLFSSVGKPSAHDR